MIDFDLYIRVQCFKRGLGRFHLGLPNIRRRMQNLALKVAQVNRIVIDKTQFANAGRSEVERRR